MAKAENKTQATSGDVVAFLANQEADRRRDCETMVQLMQEITGHPPVLWGTSIIGFGQYRYQYASGREGDWFVVGFSPRKQNLSLYLLTCMEVDETLLSRLGKHKKGAGCIYIKKLADIDLAVLRELVTMCAEEAGKRS
ncbi:MAG: DUF1801 domain-containing protein [Bacteroidetes bacterium]|nr:DUF1801 domain-containing protein [Bacteroidota bacterium]